MARLTLDLHVTERDALVKLALRERRDPRAQAALIVHDWLVAQGYLPAEPMPAQRAIEAQPARVTEVSNAPR